ncbi:predicted protein [Arabidopsis lyrata subsp. lyrata]|uniref:Predicted protein n=1 Tax=Arabidopsis lyrata subsp. lyrata TaxID=81972 RepID=D7KQM8_ARALL|nr:predicted protein [Arabidopsis lyrata subsp. lyrata]
MRVSSQPDRGQTTRYKLGIAERRADNAHLQSDFSDSIREASHGRQPLAMYNLLPAISCNAS